MARSFVERIIAMCDAKGVYCIESEKGKHTAYTTGAGEIGIFQNDGFIAMSIKEAKTFIKDLEEVVDDYEERIRMGLELNYQTQPLVGKTSGRRKIFIDEERLANCFKLGMKTNAIAEMLGVSISYVYGRRKKYEKANE